MKFKSTLTIFLGLMAIVLHAQDEPIPFRNAVSVNVTSLLGEVISVGDNKNNDKFNLLYTRFGKSTNLRLGANVFYKKSTENNAIINSGETDLIDQDYKLRLGVDWKYDLSKKFNFTGGFDILYQYNSSKSTASTAFINNISSNSYGLGPVMRFEYRLSNRIGFMTESSMYFIFGSKKDKLTQNGIVIFDNNTNFSNINTLIPSVLYLNVYF